jgi:hypothetical protein
MVSHQILALKIEVRALAGKHFLRGNLTRPGRSAAFFPKLTVYLYIRVNICSEKYKRLLVNPELIF